MCGKELFWRLVRSVCICQGGLLETILEKDTSKRKDAKEKLAQTVQKLRDVLRQRDSLGKTVASLYCTKFPNCRDDYHERYCVGHMATLDDELIERMKKEVIE